MLDSGNEGIWTCAIQEIVAVVLMMAKNLPMCWVCNARLSCLYTVSANQTFTVRATNSRTLKWIASSGSSSNGSVNITMEYPSVLSSSLVMHHMRLNCGHHPPMPSWDASLKKVNWDSCNMSRPIGHCHVELGGLFILSNMAT